MRKRARSRIICGNVGIRLLVLSRYLMCDITQIDNPDLNENFNGLTFSFEKFKDSPLCWQLTLENEESVRSNLAREAAKIL